MAATKITEKDRLFAEEYCRTLNATQAALMAGFSETSATNQGYKLLRNPEIVSLVRDSMEARAKRLLIDQSWVIQELLQVYEASMQDRDLKAATKCLELLGKHMGMFSERHVHEMVINMSDDELKRKAKEIMDRSLTDGQGKLST